LERPNTVPDYLRLEADFESEGEAEPWKNRQDQVRRDGSWEQLIPEFKQMDRRQWNRNTAVAYFTSDVLKVGESAPCWYLFHYQQGKVKAYLYGDNSQKV
jgi:anaerobic magnesium-protoporphyrin IX monomethyl ester cyclase